MRRMIAHPKLAFDDGRHALRCPDLAAETEGLRASGQEGGHLCTLLGGQLGSRARSRATPKRLDPEPLGATDPLADGAETDTKRLRDLALRPALLSKFPSAEATALPPIVWWFCSCFFHTIYDTT